MTDILVLVESNTTGTGRLFAAAARARGLCPVVLSTRPDRYPWVADDAVDVAWADTTDPAAVAEVAMHAARSVKMGGAVAGVATSSEYYVGIAARAAHLLGLPGPTARSVEACRDKRHQRAVLARSGVAVPRFEAAGSVSGAVDAAADIGLPVVLKPADGTGSRGVRLCTSLPGVAAQARALLGRRHDERGRPTLPWILVEEYVAGPEFSVETFGGEVIGLTTKHLGPLPDFVETGHDFPARPDDGSGSGADIAVAVRSAVAALGVGWGAVHTEVRMGASGPVLIEVNPRLAGGQIPVLVRHATGIDLVAATVDLAVDGHVSLPRRGPGAASIRFLVPPTRGELAGVDGRPDAAQFAGVVSVEVTAPVGATVGGTGCFLDRIGHVITAGPDPEAVRAAADQALHRLTVRLRAEDPSSSARSTIPHTASRHIGPACSLASSSLVVG